MRFILEQLRQARKREEGFTLIELLIVILILGILAGIAVFASGPFRNRAEQACTDANTEIAVIADAAVDAGVTGDLYAQSGDCSGTGGGGPGGTATFAASVVDTWEDTTASNPATVTLGTTTDGNLLVAISAHRQNVSNTVPGTPTLTGWNFEGISSFMATTSDRRAVAVWTKTAVAADSGATVGVSWAGTGITATSLIVAEIEADGEALATGTFAATSGVAGLVGDLTLNGAAGPASGSAVVITGIVGRDGPASLTWTGASVMETNSASGVLTHAGFADVESTGGTFGPSADWTGTYRASGFVLVMSP